MSLRLRRIVLDGFRKFRQPVTIDGLTDGLNIVIESNETGKSTLLEALRAALFVRHNTANSLARSYAPYGDAVGPLIKVDFEAEGASWSVTKRFLRSASVQVECPQGRSQGEEAESRLNNLLGAVRDSSRGGDAASYGALGLLWVAQTEALQLTTPSQTVRDVVVSTLEAEVGAIMGGVAYKRVRARIDEQFADYWTPTGQTGRKQKETRERFETAQQSAQIAIARLAALDATFIELESAHTRLKVINREIADQTDAETRQDLFDSLNIARAAAQILATRRAESEAATRKVRALEDLQSRYDVATSGRKEADQALGHIRAQRRDIAGRLSETRERVAATRGDRDAARLVRQNARTALEEAQIKVRVRERSASAISARERYSELIALEENIHAANTIALTQISGKQIQDLEAHERAIAEANALLKAGSTRIVFSGILKTLEIDGKTPLAGERVLTGPTKIKMGGAELLITPPSSAGSAEEMVRSAAEKRQALLTELGINGIAAARARNELARDATAELRTLEAKVAALCEADAAVNLAAGAEALKLFVAGLGSEESPEEPETLDFDAVRLATDESEETLARAEGFYESAVDALQRVETEDAPLAAAEAGAASDVTNIQAQIEAIEAKMEFETLTVDLQGARTSAAEASVKLADSERDATAHNVDAIAKKIEIIDARGRTTLETRNKLVTEIARLENTVEIEGGAGVAEHAATAAEEVDAARSAFERIVLEAETVKLLRDTLEEARTETSARFVGPVMLRAKRYIERLLPGCELAFSEDLALVSVTRAGLPEDCANLSRGTQEQLAVLTRIAFADILLEQGKPVSLILDDPLVYSDDARLDLMIEILIEVAERMQVILLTCRDRAFRHVPGHRISLVQPDNSQKL